MSEVGLFAVLAILSIGFDRALLTILRQKNSAAVKGMVFILLNTMLIFCILVASYIVDGFTVHDGLGEGWLDWTTLLTFFGAGYAPVALIFLWRVLK